MQTTVNDFYFLRHTRSVSVTKGPPGIWSLKDFEEVFQKALYMIGLEEESVSRLWTYLEK